MKKFINIIIGIVLVVLSIMVCWLSVDLRKTTEELIESYNIEPEIVFLDSITQFDTIYIERYELVKFPIYNTDTITLNDTTIIIDV